MSIDIRLNDDDKKRFDRKSGSFQESLLEGTIRLFSEGSLQYKIIETRYYEDMIIQIRKSDPNCFYRFYGLDDFIQEVNKQENYSPSAGDILAILKLYRESNKRVSNK